MRVCEITMRVAPHHYPGTVELQVEVKASGYDVFRYKKLHHQNDLVSFFDVLIQDAALQLKHMMKETAK